MSIDTLPLTDVLAETATLYETVVAQPSVVERVEVAENRGNRLVIKNTGPCENDKVMYTD